MSEHEPPLCRGPDADPGMAAHEATAMVPTDWDDDAWRCPECGVIVRVR